MDLSFNLKKIRERSIRDIKASLKDIKEHSKGFFENVFAIIIITLANILFHTIFRKHMKAEEVKERMKGIK